MVVFHIQVEKGRKVTWMNSLGIIQTGTIELAHYNDQGMTCLVVKAETPSAYKGKLITIPLPLVE